VSKLGLLKLPVYANVLLTMEHVLDAADLSTRYDIGVPTVTNNENESSQNYLPLNPVTSRLSVTYKQQLVEAIRTKNVARVRVILSVLAALNPIEYKEYLEKRKKNVEK
jgi:hypothetical protein